MLLQPHISQTIWSHQETPRSSPPLETWFQCLRLFLEVSRSAIKSCLFLIVPTCTLILCGPKSHFLIFFGPLPIFSQLLLGLLYERRRLTFDLSPSSWTVCASVGTSLPWSERCSRPISQNLIVILQELFHSLGPIRDLLLEAGPFLPRGFSCFQKLDTVSTENW